MPAESAPGVSSSMFGAVLRREREAAGLTQAALAARAGIGVNTVSNLERGINTAPYPSTVRLLAEALGLSDDAGAGLQAAAGRRQGQGPVTGGYLGAEPSTRIVGRERERTSIIAAVEAAAAGAGGVVLLTGEAGIGKTRLAQEAHAAARERGFVVAVGRCFEEQADSPFAPLLDVFATLYDASPPTLRSSVPEWWPALAALLPDLPLTAVPEQPGQDAVQQLHRAATALVSELAKHRPVAVLLDDLHWVDDASVELLTHLARTTASARVLLLGTYRGGEIRSAHPVRRLAHALHRDRGTAVVDVERFDAGTTARLVEQRLDQVPVDDAVSDLVHRHSEGNPFFTVEIVATLVERGDVTRVGDRWTCREVGDLEAPSQVGELIAERVARLAPSAQEVLRSASVLGEVFDLDDVSTIDVSDELLETALEEAVDAGLLTAEEDRYAFDHSLTQQALYAALSPVRRRRLHRAVGERLEARPAGWQRRRAAEIARHLEAGGLPARAIPFVLTAGDVATAVFARDEAVRLYSHARELAEESGDDHAVTRTLERLGQVEALTGRYAAAVDHLLGAAERHRRTGDVEAWLRVEGTIADLKHRNGEGEAAGRRLDEILADLETAGTDGVAAGGAALANGLARVRFYLGQHELCVEATGLARRLSRQEGSPVSEAEACAVAGTALFFLDRPDDATRVLEEGVAIAARTDAPGVESSLLMGLQWATTLSGDFARSIALGERGLELTRRAGNTDLESQHAAGLGRTLFYAGDAEQAEQHLVRSVDLTRLAPPTLFSGIPPVYLGLFRAAQGDAPGAIASYDEAAGAPDLQSFAFEGYLQARRGELDLAAGDPAAALARLEPWLGQECPTRVHDVSILVVAAEACLALGDVDRAEQSLEHALRRAAATRNRLEEVDARRLLGRCHQLRGRDDQARRCWDEALELAVAIGYPAAEVRVRAEVS